MAKVQKAVEYRFESEVWIYPSETAAWHFATLPKELARELKERYKDVRKGFGSLPVAVTIGEATWSTSIFPDTREDSYLLPIKADVRRREGIFAGDRVLIRICIR